MRDFLTWCSRYISLTSILLVGFIVYILFMQENSVGRMYEIDRSIDSLRRAIAVEQDTFALYRDKNRRLDDRDPELVEKVVREQHNMSLPTEDIYVFQ